VLLLVSEDIVYFERLVLLLNQNVLVELLHEFYVFELPLVGNVHEGFPSVDIDYSHGDGIIYWVKKQKHDSIAINVI
jgi:hypothetical protein